MPSRLRILHVLPSLRVGGAEQMAAHLMVSLARSHDVAVAGLASESGSAIEHRLKAAKIRSWHLGKRTGFDARMFPALIKVVRHFNPDVVHTHLSVLRYVLPVLLWDRVPVAIHTLHNAAEHESDRIGRLVQRLGFRKGVLPVAISKNGEETFARIYGTPCRAVIANSIPVKEYRQQVAPDRILWRAKENLPADAVLFTCVGRLEPQKDPRLLIDAFGEIQDPRAHLVILGDGSLRSQLIGDIRRKGLCRRVHLLGKRNDVSQWLAISDAFVLSSRWEGNPLAVMEAMASGLPVIGTAVGGVPELVDSGVQGLLVPSGNRAALTAAMQQLAGDPNQRARLGQAARDRAAAEFDVERMAAGYDALYREAYEGSTQGSPRRSMQALRRGVS